MNQDETWALLWSRSASCFHIEPLERTAAAGMNFFVVNQRNDYLLIALGTQEAVSAKADELRHVVEERAEVRRLYDEQ